MGCIFARHPRRLRIQSDVVPAGSLRVAQVVRLGTRAEIIASGETYKSLLTAGIADTDLGDGSLALVRIYCCGGVTPELSVEYSERRVMHVPQGITTAVGDYVEYRVGRSPQQGDGGRLNTVIRVVAREGDAGETCWWDPKNEALWLRVVYCEWMTKEGWVKQGGVSPAWYKPAS